MHHQLPALPYPKTALEPHISAATLEYHHAKHHRGYVDKLNKLIQGTRHAKEDLQETVMTAGGEIYNQAAQAWNHAFFWRCLSPTGGGDPTGRLAQLIKTQWGSIAKFREDFSNLAMEHFGSGWIWLVQKTADSLAIYPTPDAETPLLAGFKPLLTLDLWEHAYYLDYRHERNRYIDGFWSIVNWNFAESNLIDRWRSAN